MTPQHMKDRLKLLLSIWLGQPVTLKELEDDFGSPLNREVLYLNKEGIIEQDFPMGTFSLSRDGKRNLAHQLRRLVDNV